MSGTKSMTEAAVQRWRDPTRHHGEEGCISNATDHNGTLLGFCPMGDCGQGVVIICGKEKTVCGGCGATVIRPPEEKIEE